MKVWVLTPAAKVSVWVLRAVKSATWAVSGEAKVIVETSTVCETSEAPVRVTVKVARPPSLTVTSATLKTGRSSLAVVPPMERPSSTMVPVAVPALPLMSAPLVALVS